MAWVWVSIGSNIDRENNIRGSLQVLETEFGEAASNAFWAALIAFTVTVHW